MYNYILYIGQLHLIVLFSMKWWALKPQTWGFPLLENHLTCGFYGIYNRLKIWCSIYTVFGTPKTRFTASNDCYIWSNIRNRGHLCSWYPLVNVCISLENQPIFNR
jgi:hypothetical protein